MIQINYLILTHKNPQQLKRLVSRLITDNITFYIHVDAKCDINDFFQILPPNQNIYYVDDAHRVNGRWGDISLVKAAFQCMKLVINQKRNGMCVLMSGQDYPLRTPEYIKAYFEQMKGYNFMSVYPIPDPKKKSEGGGYERFISYTFDCHNPNNPRMKAKIKPYSLCPKTIVGFLRLMRYRPKLLPFACKCYFKKRKYPQELSMTFNEFWCALDTNQINKIITTIETNPSIMKYYQMTHIPDETLFSAILCKNPAFKEKLKPMCHYIDWETNCSGSPKIFHSEDLGKLKSVLKDNNILYARKFDEDDAVLDQIDNQLLQIK